MPNRIIKDSIHTSDTCNAMTDFQFRLWVSLITYVDDYGRGDARPAIIKGTCFPLRERLTNKEIEAGLTGLAGLGCIGLYEVDGRSYLYFPTWEKHQSIRNKKSKFPAPEDGLQKLEINCNQLQANVPVIQSESESESISESEDPPLPPEKAELDLSEFGPELQGAIQEWLQYKKEKNNSYKPTGLKRFLSEIKSKAEQYGEPAIAKLISTSMTNNWQGIFFDKLEGRNDRGSVGTAAPERDRPSRHYNIVSAKLD